MRVSIAVAASIKTRMQSGCIPYADFDGVRKVLLVKKKTKTSWWGFTKGGLEPHLNRKDNAAKECFEEGGVTGEVTKKIGEFQYEKGGVKQKVHMYAMQALVELDAWPEMKSRSRRWFTLESAKRALSNEHHKFIDAIAKQPASSMP